MIKQITKVLQIFLILVFLVSVNTPTASALVGVAPSMGTAAPYSVIGKAQVTNVPALGTVLSGFVGADTTITGFGAGTGVSAGQVLAPAVNTPEADALSAYTALAAQTPGTGLDIGGTNTVTAGVYDIAQFTMTGGVLTLNGPGVYIFQGTGNTAINAGSTVSLVNGATACNVFWRIPTSMTIGTGVTMVGTIIVNTGNLTIANGTTLAGRAIALVGQVTLDNNLISGPNCTAPVVSHGPSANLTVVKHVINDNGGTAIASNFMVSVKDIQSSGDVISAPNVSGSPQAGKEAPGTMYQLPQGTYAIKENINSNYSVSYSGDCDALGRINLYYGDNKTCIMTNNDIAAPVPPLIDVVKVANPLALPLGPGLVLYTYTATNIGIVPITGVTMKGDSCSPLVFISGDTNNDNKLDVTEAWKYTCTTMVSATHTNTVTATGYANGLSSVHTAQATVVVGLPLIPPLIHVVKIPSPLTLPVGGGDVVYRYTVTNPGVAPLANVSLADNKCTGLPSRVSGHPGDLNKNDLLEVGESWSFICNSHITSTTTNTVVATGHANGYTITDVAYATVVVASPKLPNTGLGDTRDNTPFVVLAILGLISSVIYTARKKQIN